MNDYSLLQPQNDRMEQRPPRPSLTRSLFESLSPDSSTFRIPAHVAHAQGGCVLVKSFAAGKEALDDPRVLKEIATVLKDNAQRGLHSATAINCMDFVLDANTTIEPHRLSVNAQGPVSWRPAAAAPERRATTTQGLPSQRNRVPQFQGHDQGAVITPHTRHLYPELPASHELYCHEQLPAVKVEDVPTLADDFHRRTALQGSPDQRP